MDILKVDKRPINCFLVFRNWYALPPIYTASHCLIGIYSIGRCLVQWLADTTIVFAFVLIWHCVCFDKSTELHHRKALFQNGYPIAFSIQKTDNMYCGRLLVDQIKDKIVFNHCKADVPGGYKRIFCKSKFFRKYRKRINFRFRFIQKLVCCLRIF